ncbi:hypothetical protein HD554DRAFT_2173746 [Boletus coccyginus]|nr:hypothetical protein HD554DRAFT_2173746 [Boletus coccyginus]
MSGPPDGKYFIVLAGNSAPPPFPVGADEQGPTSPVITGAKDIIWTATKLPNGNYTLILEQNGPRWLSQAGENEVFVSLMPLPGEWRIQRQEDGTYSIEVPSPIWPTRAWTLNNTTPGTKAEWVLDFKQRISKKSERLGDVATNAQQLEAISHYSVALSLDPAAPQGLFIRRSKGYTARGLWKDALDDANKLIMLDPSSPWGYKRKHTALQRSGRYDDAIASFETMLLKISQSPDPEIRATRHKYVNPEEIRAAIRVAVENVIRESPLVLINTDLGRLLDKSEQAYSFESQPILRELMSSMSTRIDHSRINHEVADYYRYATFSHKWEDNEPLFEKVLRIVVYDLDESLTHDKLQMFCKIVRDSGYHWAWSDTCCIDKRDHFMLQEALVSMFKWYEGSAVTIVLLRGIRSPSKRGDLVRSIWNSRAWTLQEYHASKVVRFYTEDWKPYLDLDIPNHKESPEIVAEMEEATHVSARALMALRPGLDDVREKLLVYGDGDKALGRFLAQLLTSSGDTSILAWTGRSGSFNSCLPTNIAVFNHLPTTHVPLALKGAEMDKTTRLRTPSLSSTSLMKLYDRLHDLPVPFFVGQRMKLPCLDFKLGPLSASRSGLWNVFRAQTAIGVVEIRTEEDLSRFSSLYLVHPWIDFLLGQQPVGSIAETILEEQADDQSSSIGGLPSFPHPSSVTLAASKTRTARLISRLGRPFSGSSDDASLQFMARLRQPFGALLLTPHLKNVGAYRRVATDSLITAQVEEITPTMLNKLINSVHVLDVL